MVAIKVIWLIVLGAAILALPALGAPVPGPDQPSPTGSKWTLYRGEVHDHSKAPRATLSHTPLTRLMSTAAWWGGSLSAKGIGEGTTDEPLPPFLPHRADH